MAEYTASAEFTETGTVPYREHRSAAALSLEAASVERRAAEAIATAHGYRQVDWLT